MKKKLYKAFESATPNVLDQVLQACPAPEKETAEKGIIHRTDRQWYKSALSTAAAVALLISVCGVAVWMFSRGQLGITDPTEPSTEATLPTDPTQTDTLPPPTTEPIQTETDPPVTEPLPTDGTEATKHPWYVETPPTMSYEEFFSKPRVLRVTQDSVWTAPTGTEYILRTAEEGLQVWQNRGRAFYTVPGFEGPDCGVTPIFCNGNIAYVHSDTQLLRLDVMTGE